MNSIGIGEIIASQSEGERGLLKLRSTLWSELLNFIQKLLITFLLFLKRLNEIKFKPKMKDISDLQLNQTLLRYLGR